MKIIFLDIDGVLNNYDTLGEGLDWEPSLVEILNRIIKETEAKVVISSTWRRTERHRNIIKNDMKINFIDITPKLWEERGYEIQAWLDKNPDVERFIILDDDSDMVHLMSHLIQTDGKFGLTNENANEAIKRLS
jgi:hypothetical protein